MRKGVWGVARKKKKQGRQCVHKWSTAALPPLLSGGGVIELMGLELVSRRDGPSSVSILPVEQPP